MIFWFGFLFAGLVGCSTAPVFCESQQSFLSMGSVFELQLKSTRENQCNQDQNETLYLWIQDTLTRLDQELSLYQPQSALSRLNKHGKVEAVSDDFLKVLNLSIESQRKTHGVFDVTLLSAINSMKNGRLPSRKLVGPGLVKISDRSISFKQKGVEITFDGIAKGYAVDKVSEHLEALGYRNYLVNFSGNMRWRGRRADNGFWAISMWNPVTKNTIPLEGTESGAIATSGPEHRGKHIMDPRDFSFPELYSSVSAIGPSAAICDVLSTTLYALDEKTADTMLKIEYSDYKVWRVLNKN